MPFAVGNTPLNQRLAGAVLVLLLAGCSSPAQTVAPTAAPKPTAAAQPASAAATSAAPKPADATLQIMSPKNGEVVSAGPVKVSINYVGPTLVPGAEAKKLDDYHLHYFLDEDPSAFLNAPRPIPTGNPHIVHSAAKEVTFDGVAPGSHTVAIVMSGNNHIPVSPSVTSAVTFTAQ
jgi:hypothetical protein